MSQYMPHNRYYMPPEWTDHSHTLLVWPDNRETWPGESLNRAEHVYADILEALTPHEKVLLLLANEQAQQAASAMIQHRNIDWDRIRLIRMPVNDVWIRDYGPICLISEQGAEGSEQGAEGSERGAEGREQQQGGRIQRPGSSEQGIKGSEEWQGSSEEWQGSSEQRPGGSEQHPGGRGKLAESSRQIVMSNWEYNAWGGKYPPFDADNAVPGKLARLLDYPVVSTGMVLEGGSIDVNGAGSVLTTESVLLNPNRNPGMSKNDIEMKLKHFLGVNNVIWLKKGLKGDDTDGHIDDLARFVSSRTIVTTVSDDTGDPNYETLQENLKILLEATDAEGRPFEIIKLPLPLTRIEGSTVDGSSFVPASYTNFYIANRCVLVPLYDSRYDDAVVNIFRSLFPDREIHGIRCNDLVWGQGAIHCITLQVL